MRRPELRFGILCVLGYVVLSWAVRFDLRFGGQILSLVYPLDTFSMYSGIPRSDGSSLLLVRDAQGVVHRVESFRSFDCAGPITGDDAPCRDSQGIPYHFEDLARYVESHAGPGDEAVELITRTWLVKAGAAPVHLADCVVSRCRVSR